MSYVDDNHHEFNECYDEPEEKCEMSDKQTCKNCDHFEPDHSEWDIYNLPWCMLFEKVVDKDDKCDGNNGWVKKGKT